jgi:hypothetical protein
MVHIEIFDESSLAAPTASFCLDLILLLLLFPTSHAYDRDSARTSRTMALATLVASKDVEGIVRGLAFTAERAPKRVRPVSHRSSISAASVSVVCFNVHETVTYRRCRSSIALFLSAQPVLTCVNPTQMISRQGAIPAPPVCSARLVVYVIVTASI